MVPEHPERVLPYVFTHRDPRIVIKSEHRRENVGKYGFIFDRDGKKQDHKEDQQRNGPPPLANLQKAGDDRRDQKDRKSGPGVKEQDHRAAYRPEQAVTENSPLPLLRQKPAQKKWREEIEDPGDLQFSDPGIVHDLVGPHLETL